MTWNFPLLKTLLTPERKKKAEKGNAEDLFCKSLAPHLKEMALYERLNAKNEIRGFLFKYQMLLLARQPSPSLQRERLSQTMQGNSVPLDCSNINYLSALSDMPPSTPIQRKENTTNEQGGSNSGGFLSSALSKLSSPSSFGSSKEI